MKTINFKGLKNALSRNEMRDIYAGVGPVTPPKKYMCCWTDSAICSACEAHSSQATCVKGATLTAC
jgi:hypothetical protein